MAAPVNCETGAIRGRFKTRPGPARGPNRAATAVPSGAGSLLGHRIPRKRALPRGPYLTHERRSEEHTSELQSLMRISYAVFCLKKKNKHNTQLYIHTYY